MKTKIFFFLTLLLGATASQHSALAQVVNAHAEGTASLKPSDCIELADAGKYRFYLNSEFMLTAPACASFYREATFDVENVMFNGNFTDFTMGGNVLAAGAYSKGYLSGHCEIYYTNGTKWQEGVFIQGSMVDAWRYYHPNGSPMYTLAITDKNVKLMDVWDANGQKVLSNGNGEASIPYFKYTATLNEADLVWKGEVKDGLLNGRWREYKNGLPTGVEEIYRRGKFIKGFVGERTFNTVSFFKLEQDISFLQEVSLKLSDCDLNNAFASVPAHYLKGTEQLQRDVLNYLGRYITAKYANASVSVSFLVKADGTLDDFKAESVFGIEKNLIKALQQAGSWEPATASLTPVEERVIYTLRLVPTSNRRKFDRPLPSEQFHQTNHQPSWQEREDIQRTFNPPTIYRRD